MTHPRPEPSGANNYLRWRRSIDEHLELRRLSWGEYGMFNWLCTKAGPSTGIVRTSWSVLAEQTGLSRDHVEQLCRSLKRKRYVFYPAHRGVRGRLTELAIHKFPLTAKTYTDLSACFAEVPTDAPADLPTDVPMELEAGCSRKTGASPPGRYRERERRSTLRVRSADADRAPDSIQTQEASGTDPEETPSIDIAGAASGDRTHPTPDSAEPPAERASASSPPTLTRAEALARAPSALRETLELFFAKTGREAIDPDDLACLDRLDRAHTPAVIQKTMTAAATRFTRRGQPLGELTLCYVWESVKHFTTRTSSATGRPDARARSTAAPAAHPKYPPGFTRLRW